jgi:hypothetical protein
MASVSPHTDNIRAICNFATALAAVVPKHSSTNTEMSTKRVLQGKHSFGRLNQSHKTTRCAHHRQHDHEDCILHLGRYTKPSKDMNTNQQPHNG